MSDATPEPQAPQYKDDDLVYVDPDQKKVIGKVEFGKNDKPKSLAYKPIVVAPKAPDAAPAKGGKPDKKERGQFWRKFYPFGTYKSMRKIYKLEGKVKEAEPNRTFEEVLPRALSEAYWTWDKPKELPKSE